MDDFESQTRDSKETWIFASSIRHAHLRRLVVQARVVDWTFVNIVIEETSTSICRETVEMALEKCRRKYGCTVPPFSQTPFLRLEDGDMELWEQIDPLLLSALPQMYQELAKFHHPLRSVPANQLESMIVEGTFFPPNCRLVRVNGTNYVAKGPVYPSRIEADMQELRTLLSLPGHCRYIIPRPDAIVAVSETDSRICGFLSRFYPNGNLDIYAQRLRSRNKLTVDKLCMWFHQLVCAVQFLASHNTWHGDIKPDNILIDDDENVVLTDFARIFATSATASPEVQKNYLLQNKSQSMIRNPVTANVPHGIPSNWPIERAIASEIYSIGRTMYLISEGISMMKIYQTVGWVNVDHKFTSVFSPENGTPNDLRDIICDCMKPNAADRITLKRLNDVLEDMNGLNLRKH
jgi:serine/threonine protein kinase